MTLPIALGGCTSGGSGPADADAREAGVSVGDHVACVAPGDCLSLAEATSSAYCCVDNSCVPDTPGDCTDANVQLVQASTYDQSCTTDGDCALIFQGNACHLPFGCGDPAAINMHAYAQFQSDLSKARGASCIDPRAGDCAGVVTCCRSGSCRTGDQCGGDASAE